jgi:hypothetical protein
MRDRKNQAFESCVEKLIVFSTENELFTFDLGKSKWIRLSAYPINNFGKFRKTNINLF